MRRPLAIAAALVVVLTGCGGSNHEPVNPERMLDQAARHPISSADVEIEARLRVLGVERLSQPIRARFEGPFVSGGAERIPSVDWRFSASALGFPVGGRLVSTGDNAFLTVYGDQYEVGRATGRRRERAPRRIGRAAPGPAPLARALACHRRGQRRGSRL